MSDDGFDNPIVGGIGDLVINDIRSKGYIEATTGWKISKDGNAEFQNLSLPGTIGARTIDAQILKQGGLPLDDIVAPFAQGLEAWKFNQDGVVRTWAAAGEKIMETTAVLRPGRIYLCAFFGAALGGTVAGETNLLYMTQTASVDQFTAPVAPTAASTMVTSAAQRYLTGGTLPVYANCWGWTSNLGTVPIQVTIALCIKRLTAAGAPQTFMTDAFGSRLNIFDGGLEQADVGSNYLPGGGGAGTTPTIHDVTWSCVPAFGAGTIQTYQGNGFLRTDSNGTTYAYQGYFSSQWGNMAGLFSFDSAAIRAATAGATILSTYVYVQNVHSYANAGVTALIGTHNTDAPFPGFIPATSQGRWSLSVPKGGSAWTPDLGAGLGQEIRDGTTRGVMVGAAPSLNLNYYSFFNAAQIRIIYSK